MKKMLLLLMMLMLMLMLVLVLMLMLMLMLMLLLMLPERKQPALRLISTSFAATACLTSIGHVLRQTPFEIRTMMRQLRESPVRH